MKNWSKPSELINGWHESEQGLNKEKQLIDTSREATATFVSLCGGEIRGAIDDVEFKAEVEDE